MPVHLNYNGVSTFITQHEISNIKPLIKTCHNLLENKNGAGNDFLGWVNLPVDYNKEEFARIKSAAEKIKANSKVLIVIGIGGSYLGARAAIDFIKSPFYNNKTNKDTPDIYFVGNNISSAYLNDVINVLGDRDFSVNVISKSGTTTEPAIAFRIFKTMLEKKYGKEGAKERIFATTDKTRGALKTLSNDEGYETFEIADDIGGRYSVLTGVGLLPMAAAGIDIDKVMYGAKYAYDRYSKDDFENNECYQYAALRNCLYRKGKNVEILANYEPSITTFGEWFKQLFAESEGKDNKGIFPVSANFSTDLHSIGQFIQAGTRNLFETVIWCRNSNSDVILTEDKDNIDGLNFLAGKTMQFVNSKAFEGTLLAHVDGGTPNIILEIDNTDEFAFGDLVYFFERACAISGYLLGVNPFDQPGVEGYKNNMFALLGKPGYEAQKAVLEKRLI